MAQYFIPGVGVINDPGLGNAFFIPGGGVVDEIQGSATYTVDTGLDAILQSAGSATGSIDALLKKTGIVASVSADAYLQQSNESILDIDALLQLIGYSGIDLDANLQTIITQAVSLEALLRNWNELDVSMDARLQIEREITLVHDALLSIIATTSTELDANLSSMKTVVADVDGLIERVNIIKTLSIGALLRRTGVVKTVNTEAYVAMTKLTTGELHSLLLAMKTISTQVGAYLASAEDIDPDPPPDDDNELNVNNIRQIISPNKAGKFIRVALTGSLYGVTNLVGVSIGERSGTTEDMTGTPTRFTFGGSNAVTLSVGSTVYSDWLEYTVDRRKQYLIHFATATAPNWFKVKSTGTIKEYSKRAPGVDDTMVADISGYTPNALTVSIAKLESQVGVVGLTYTESVSMGAYVNALGVITTSVDAMLKGTPHATTSLDACVAATRELNAILDVAMQENGITKEALMDALLVATTSVFLDAKVQWTDYLTATLDGMLQKADRTKTLSLGGYTAMRGSETVSLGALLKALSSSLCTTSLDSRITKVREVIALIDAYVLGQYRTAGIDALLSWDIEPRDVVSAEPRVRTVTAEARTTKVIAQHRITRREA